MHEKIVYLNGSFVPESEAKVSVLDMGFHAGDGVYDVTRTFRHKPFKLKEHNDRLFRSLKYTRIDCGMSQEEMEAAALGGDRAQQGPPGSRTTTMPCGRS